MVVELLAERWKGKFMTYNIIMPTMAEVSIAGESFYANLNDRDLEQDSFPTLECVGVSHNFIFFQLNAVEYLFKLIYRTSSLQYNRALPLYSRTIPDTTHPPAAKKMSFGFVASLCVP